MLDKRAIGILLLTFAFLFFYQNVLIPTLYPPPPPKPVVPGAQPGETTTGTGEKLPVKPGDGTSPGQPTTQPETPARQPEPTESISPAPPDTGEKPVKPEPEPETETEAQPQPELDPQPDIELREDLVLDPSIGESDASDQKATLRAVFTNKGAALKRLEILDHHRSSKDRTPLPIVQEIQVGVNSLVLEDVDGAYDLANRVYEWEEDRLDASPPEMSFVARFPNTGISVRKAFSLMPETAQRHLNLRIEIENRGRSDKSLSLQLRSAAGIPPETPVCGKLNLAQAPPDNLYTFAFAGQQKPNGTIAVEEENFGSIHKSRKKDSQPITVLQYPTPFVGCMNRYFAVALMAPEETDKWSRSAVLDTVGPNNVTAYLQSAKLEISAGQTAVYDFKLYAGPKSQAALQDYPVLKSLFDFGWFDAIANLLLYLLKVFHFFTQHLGKAVGGFGLAIIFLTFLVRGLLHPLSRKAQVSMHSMSKLSPEMQKLKDRYSEDKQRLNQEMMKLYKEHNVNPAGGCLPMLLQFPVFIALYRVLQSSISLRGENFLWMADLSQPDALVCFGSGFFISSFNVLPLLMVALWIYQQKITPQSKDPQQEQMRKMMMFMPIMFGVMFYGMPSGLVLYFVVSSSVGLVESKMIKKALADKDEVQKQTASTPKGRVVPRKKRKKDRFGR